ncbi:MAG: tRNA epoxyqueuosine(34) reductase QueG [Deltaproteobacteria bacterium]|nr:tRNA epoxyqueuosine(34) reductase QueG [Deltaproteobacteria bacterium]
MKAAIRRDARQLGFPLCGFAPLQPPPHGEFVRTWLKDGNAGNMSYLGRGLKKRLDPARVLPTARSVITVGFPYRPTRPAAIDWRAEMRGRIAAYAFGPDYHDIVRGKLEQLAASVRALGAAGTRTYIDTGPILEREWANLGGLGWFGKNTTILHQHEGSWFFLGEIFTDLEFDPEPIVADHCGTCRRCLDLCPTGALKDGYVMDARLCISYLTIEYRGVIPRELRSKMGEWIFGCDICQEVCPWNDTQRSHTAEELHPYLPDLLALDADTYQRRFAGSAVSRASRDCFVRNVAVALGNSRNPRAVSCLSTALDTDPSPLVRAHAAWALSQIDDAAARRALDRVWRSECEETVRAEIKASLDTPAARTTRESGTINCR